MKRVAAAAGLCFVLVCALSLRRPALALGPLDELYVVTSACPSFGCFFGLPNSQIEVVSLATMTHQRTILLGAVSVAGIAVSPDGSHLYASTTDDAFQSGVGVYDVSTGIRLTFLPVNAPRRMV